jgi:hypothetical protein
MSLLSLNSFGLVGSGELGWLSVGIPGLGIHCNNVYMREGQKKGDKLQMGGVGGGQEW